jgi:lipopolysaccharide transport system permease protein
MRLHASPYALIHALKAHHHLLRQLIIRDIVSRYKGSALGVLWSFVTPLLMLATYSVVFGVIFQSRFGESATGDTPHFALTLFAGLMLHSWVAECLTRSPSIILQHSAYVKKVVFPLEILPVMVVCSGLMNVLISLMILVVALLCVTGTMPSTLWVAPLLLLSYMPLLTGISWILASLGTYVRDIQQLMQLICTLLLFLSPIFYPASSLPEWLQPYLWLNPLAFMVEQFRAVVIMGEGINITASCIMFALNCIVMQIGSWWFQRTRSGFADIM